MAVMTTPTFDKSPVDLKANLFAPADVMSLDPGANGVHDVLFDEATADMNSVESVPQDRTEDPAHDLKDAAQSEPTANGNHMPSDTSPSTTEPTLERALEPTTNVSSGIDGVAQFMSDAPLEAKVDSAPDSAADTSNGIDGVAQFLPDIMQDTNSLFGDSEDIGTTVTLAVEAPTSEVRDEVDTKQELLADVPASSERPGEVLGDQLDVKDDLFEDAMEITANVADDAKPPPSSDAAPTNSMTDLSIQTQTDTALAPESTQSPMTLDMDDAPLSGRVRRREDDEDDVPDAKRTKTEDEPNGQVDFKIPDVPAHVEQSSPNANGAPRGVAVPISHEPSGLQRAVDYEKWPTNPMTEAQNKFLIERIRNTKKIKVSLAFKDPVDPVALNIPTYFTLVTKPMDLSTMEGKLKEKRYTYVRDFMADLDQMIENSELFNNKQHPVTQAGYNLRAYFMRGMDKLPLGGSSQPPKPVKAKKSSSSSAPKARRDSKPPATVKSPTVPTPKAASPPAAWPLGQDGIPVIRRDSSSANDRPKREIHRPSKDLPYSNAKPRKKKYQQELKFCESVMAELTKPKYAAVTYPFMAPVDPVALNIPSYLKIIKKPMDFGTIDRNLKAGVYQSAKDFHADAQLVFQNCYKFNPEGDAVNKMGKQLESLFDDLWKEKADWLAQHAPAPEQSPGELYSDEEDEEEEEEEEVDPAQAQFLAIQQQIAALNETAQQLLKQQTAGKRASPQVQPKKKAKVAPPPPKKKAPLSVPPPVNARANKQKVRPKAPAPLSFAQKQEISEGISTLGDADMRKAVQIIRNGCPHLANVNDDEMELDMDEINDETLRELFRFIKSIRGPRAGAANDDDFEPPRQSHKQQTAARPKKNKPMGKSEQEENMRKIQEKLNSFQGGASGSSQSPPAQDDSDDDDSSASESEEE